MNYTQEVKIIANKQRVFDALSKQMELWWGKVDQTIKGVGDEFSVFFGKAYWTFQIVEFEENDSMAWKVIDGQPEFNNEWVGTLLLWQLKEDEGKVIVSFTHLGLVPEFDCYDICAPTWDMFITKSLKQFVETGKGTPHL